MPIVLFRIDERLIHGQVVVGWGSQLRPDRYVVVDDALAQSDWEIELYALGVPEGTESLFVGVEEAREALPGWKSSPTRTILLTRTVEAMASLARGGLLRGEGVNLGGLHFSRGREEVLPYLYLDESDREGIRVMVREGAGVTARDLPGSGKVPLDDLLG